MTTMLNFTSRITSTIERPVALLPLTRVSMTKVYDLHVLIQSTLNCKADEYQVAYVPKEVITFIGAVALQDHSLGITDLVAVSSVNGKAGMSCGIVAMPPRD